MKFIVSSSSLLKNLQVASGVLSTSNTLPILDNFQFETVGQNLTISASDIETTIVNSVVVESKEDGKIAVPAKLLMDILKTFPDQPLTFSVDGDLQIEIVSDNGNYKLSGFNADEFPKFPQLEDSSVVTIESSHLQRAITKTIFATGNDDIRPVMSGVFCQIEEEQITFAATDAHKLVRYRRTDCSAENTADFILPKKPLNLLKSILGSVDENVSVAYNETNVFFTFGEIKLACRLIEGKYPNYQAVIPEVNPNKLVVDRNLMLNSLKRVSIFANKTTHQVRLKLSGALLTVMAEDLDFSNEAVETINCQYEGDTMEIGFNSRFLIEMLSNIDTTEVKIEMSAPNRAGILTPVVEDATPEDILMLVMPVMLNS
jgi:DNA polymerase III subunit beta